MNCKVNICASHCIEDGTHFNVYILGTTAKKEKKQQNNTMDLVVHVAGMACMAFKIPKTYIFVPLLSSSSWSQRRFLLSFASPLLNQQYARCNCSKNKDMNLKYWTKITYKLRVCCSLTANVPRSNSRAIFCCVLFACYFDCSWFTHLFLL